MIVYRISRSKYSQDLSGKGAELVGGRWNSKGKAIIYTGENIALCMAEVAVHMPLGIVPKDYQLIHIEIPEEDIQVLNNRDIPDDWRESFTTFDSQQIGNRFLEEEKYIVLKVPSMVVQGQFNFLINPNHPKIKKVKIKKIEPFVFDGRLFVR
jgi:RES domain-containing protein